MKTCGRRTGWLWTQQRTWFAIIGLGLSLIFGGSRVLAAEPPNELATRLRELVDKSATWRPPSPSRTSWRVGLKPISTEKLAAWEAEVAKHPDNPLRSMLDTQRSIAKTVGSTVRTELWLGNDQLWRLCQDHPYAEFQFLDCARNGNAEWRLDARTLAMSDHGHGEKSAGNTAGDARYDDAFTQSRVFVSQGLLAVPGMQRPWKAVEVKSDGLEWTARIIFPTDSFAIVHGSRKLDADALDIGRISEISFTEKGKTFPRVSVKVSGIVEPAFEALLPSQIVLRTVDETTEEYTFEGSQRCTLTDVERVAAIPTPKQDAVRGKLTLQRIDDLRGKSAKLQVKQGEEWKELVLPTGDQPGMSDGIIRVVGWVVLAVAVSGLVWVRFRRKT